MKVRNHRLAEKLGLFETIVAPNFQQDVRAASGAILLDPLDALVGRAGDGANFLEAPHP